MSDDDRSQALWSTESAPALGVSKYGTPASVWLKKKGLIPDVVKRNEAMEVGLAVQPSIAKLYTDRTGTPLTDITALALRVQIDALPLGAHFDYRTPDARLVECKNFAHSRRAEFGEAGSGDVPTDVLVQCLHQMAVYPQIDAVDNAVLFGGQRLEIFTIERNPAAIAKLIEKLKAFWALVAGDIPPEPMTPEDARALYPKDSTGVAIEASHYIAGTCINLNSVRESIKTLQEIEAGYKTKIQAYMKDAAALTYAGKTLATWKLTKGRKGYTVTDQSPTRMFKIRGDAQ